MSATTDVVAAGLREPLAELGVDLEDVQINKAGRRHVLTVVVDRDGGVDLDTVAEVSQRVSVLLDDTELGASVPGPYVLEVSSPGVDRPLTEERHWRRATGRLVEVTLADGSVLSGRVTGAPADGVVELTTDSGERTVALADVRRAVVQVEFTRSDDDRSDDRNDDDRSDDDRSDDE